MNRKNRNFNITNNTTTMSNKITKGYNITNDPNFLDKQNGITPELSKYLDRYYQMAIDGKKSSLPKILSAIEKYPNIAKLKNFLSVLYSQLGDMQKSYEINHRIIAEHPDYLFGKINLAHEFYFKQEYNKMAEILGETFDLHALYPHRDTFHINEVVSFQKCAVLYFAAIGKIEDAEIRYELMNELAPDSQDTESVFKQLTLARMKVGMEKLQKENEERVKVDVNKQAKTSKNIPPEFTHPELEILYQKGLYIEEALINKILALPRKSLIRDLETVLNDSIERFSYFSEKFENEGWPEETTNFVLHAFFLLGELESEESIDCVFQVLSQSDEYFDVFLGDFLTSALWEPIYKIAHNQLYKCMEFMQLPGIHTYSKTIFPDIAEQIVHHQPQRREEIIEWYRQVINFYLSGKAEDNVIDSDVIGLLICNLLNTGIDELTLEIEQLYKKKIVSTGICGTYADVKKDFGKYDKDYHQKEILQISERYKNITETWAGYADKNEVKPQAFDNYYKPPTLPLTSEPKIGRNDPCPCGSGKKYKMCCLNK